MAEAKIRLLICHTCQSIDELPDYEGDPERDDTLNYRVAEHHFPSGNPHIGSLARVEAKSWQNKNHRQGILEKLGQAKAPGQGEGLGQTYYDVKGNFQQDALKCWKAHGRTSDCADYRHDNKRLVPDTKGERKDLGLSPSTRPNTWLCDFCPVSSVVTTAMRKKRGDYN